MSNHYKIAKFRAHWSMGSRVLIGHFICIYYRYRQVGNGDQEMAIHFVTLLYRVNRKNSPMSENKEDMQSF